MQHRVIPTLAGIPTFLVAFTTFPSPNFCRSTCCMLCAFKQIQKLQPWISHHLIPWRTVLCYTHQTVPSLDFHLSSLDAISCEDSLGPSGMYSEKFHILFVFDIYQADKCWPELVLELVYSGFVTVIFIDIATTNVCFFLSKPISRVCISFSSFQFS